MSSASLFELLTMLPGAIWLCAALYFQLVFDDRVHPGYVIVMLLMGASLLMLSSVWTLPHRPAVVQLLVVTANVILSLLGIVVSIAVRERLDEPTETVDDIAGS